MTWQLALAQHPMYLSIREDTQCAERTPPWGEPTIEGYVERIRENLATLRKYPQLKLVHRLVQFGVNMPIVGEVM